jgi:hypothetical protein
MPPARLRSSCTPKAIGRTAPAAPRPSGLKSRKNTTAGSGPSATIAPRHLGSSRQTPVNSPSAAASKRRRTSAISFRPPTACTHRVGRRGVELLGEFAPDRQWNRIDIGGHPANRSGGAARRASPRTGIDSRMVRIVWTATTGWPATGSVARLMRAPGTPARSEQEFQRGLARAVGNSIKRDARIRRRNRRRSGFRIGRRRPTRPATLRNPRRRAFDHVERARGRTEIAGRHGSGGKAWIPARGGAGTLGNPGHGRGAGRQVAGRGRGASARAAPRAERRARDNDQCEEARAGDNPWARSGHSRAIVERSSLNQIGPGRGQAKRGAGTGSGCHRFGFGVEGPLGRVQWAAAGDAIIAIGKGCGLF